MRHGIVNLGWNPRFAPAASLSMKSAGKYFWRGQVDNMAHMAKRPELGWLLPWRQKDA
jgi:hypothetical protein